MGPSGWFCGILCTVLSFVLPMLATDGCPGGTLDGWVVEPKADGWRAQVAFDVDGLRVWTRQGRDITSKVPELAAIAEVGVECVLDGEVVTGAGLPADFYPLAGLISSRRRSSMLTFVAFDILRLNGRSLLDYEHAARRRLLERLVRLSDGALTSVATFDGEDLDDVLASCEQLEMEGVVVKRRTSVYRPGRRSVDWRKVGCAGWRAEHARQRRIRQ